MRKALGVMVVLGLCAALVLTFMSSRTSLAVHPEVRVIGTETPVHLRVDNPHGLRRLSAYLEQDGARHTVFEETQPAHRLFFFGKKEPPREVPFTAGSKSAPSLKDGKARLVIEARANDFRSRTDRLAIDVDVNTQPPRVVAGGHQHYINQGGAELVTFTVSGYWTEAGVRVGPHEFRSFPLPGRPANERFAMFAYPWDLPPGETPVVFARNPSGAEARAHFWFKLFPKRFRSRQLELSDGFLQKVVDQIEPVGGGDLLTRFLKINGEMRRQNNQTLADLRFKTEENILWSGPFFRYGKVEAHFADMRTYVYKGKAVDKQTHLGFDLSDLQRVPVVAANDGRVVFAEDLGIYGNCIVVDHGYALQSIYGHLSEIHVKPGDRVKKGQTMGRTGETGLAGGDHLHFSMQIDGVQINPLEWWDENWIQNRILSKVPGRS